MNDFANEKEKTRELYAETLTQGCINERTYEVDDSFRDGDNTFFGVHTIPELVKHLETNKDVDFEGIFLTANPKEGEIGAVRMNRKQFLESWNKNAKKKNFKKVMEGFDGGGSWTSGNLIGNDYTPLLGGPFHKQLYLHDMLRMFALAFHASNHDPIARALLNITVDFTLGRGYRVDSKNKKALAVWRAFERVNKLPELMRFIAHGLARDGEVLPWWLPQGQQFVEWQLKADQLPPDVAIPRVKLIDPSTCWEVITYPEDIDRVIAYQLVYPTQYNLYTAKDGTDGENVRTMKFIMQQVPASQVMHFRVNRAPNEKRGRSDLYPIFGYLKRLRDAVEYSVVAMSKAAAWAIDTTIDGSVTDVQNYVADQKTQRSIAPAGSEFVHSPKIKREYLSNQATSQGGSVSAFEWCLNMICAAMGIPVSYLGTHLSGGQTKASALVGTEPVTKKFEARQLVYEDILRSMWTRLMDHFGIQDAECEISFPELISQDRSAKIKDLITAQEVDAIDHEYMCTQIAQELGYTSYDYRTAMAKIKIEKAEKLGGDADNVLIAPLSAKATAPAAAAPASGGKSSASDENTTPKPSKVTKAQRRQQALQDRNA